MAFEHNLNMDKFEQPTFESPVSVKNQSETLSGSKSLTTIGEGMGQAIDVPKNIVDNPFSKMETNFDYTSDPLVFKEIEGVMAFEHNINMDEIEQFAFEDPVNVKNKTETVTSVEENRLVNTTHNETENKQKTESSQGNNGSVIKIGHLHLNVDLKDLEDLKFLKRIVDDVKDLVNQDNDEPEPI